jgi:hypothetical protein
MPFSIRPFRRFLVCCPLTSLVCLHERQGTIWNLSVNGWLLASDVPLGIGQTCPLTVHSSNQLSLFVAGPIVRCVRGQEYGLETLAVDKPTQSWVEPLVHQLEQVVFESIE